MRTIVSMFTVLLVAIPVFAQDTEDEGTSAGAAAKVVIAAAIEGREPVDAGDTFLGTIGKLYCWSRIEGAEPGTNVHHVWYHDESEVSRVTLAVGSASWRTWSSKTIPASATGSWRVDVESDGTVLGSTSFTIR